MNSREKVDSAEMNFTSISQTELPQGRNGKHKAIVTKLLSDLDRLPSGQALKIPISDLPDSKENIRSALNRATTLKKVDVATSSDEEYFYVWVPPRNAK
jgi:TusA-related sulfurtransferase